MRHAGRRKLRPNDLLIGLPVRTMGGRFGVMTKKMWSIRGSSTPALGDRRSDTSSPRVRYIQYQQATLLYHTVLVFLAKKLCSCVVLFPRIFCHDLAVLFYCTKVSPPCTVRDM